MGRPYQPETNPPGRQRPVPVRSPGSWGRDPDLPDADFDWLAERMLTDLCLTFLSARVKIGPLLRHVRAARGESLEDVAAATGLSMQAVKAIELGERKPLHGSVRAIAAWAMRMPSDPERQGAVSQQNKQSTPKPGSGPPGLRNGLQVLLRDEGETAEGFSR